MRRSSPRLRLSRSDAARVRVWLAPELARKREAVRARRRRRDRWCLFGITVVFVLIVLLLHLR